MTIPILLALAVLSGILGRMGGAGKSGQWYDRFLDTKWRDWGCPTVRIAAIALIWGLQAQFWWVYGLVWLLSWGAFSTYWDGLFGGEDNLWFSGAVAGAALAPLAIINPAFWALTAGAAVVLCLVWGSLNKYLPADGILCWDRGVVEENLRYFVSL